MTLKENKPKHKNAAAICEEREALELPANPTGFAAQEGGSFKDISHLNSVDSPAAPRAGTNGAPRPFDGWALDAARELERRAFTPIVSHLLYASDLRRGAAFLALAAWCAPHPDQRVLFTDVTVEEFAAWLLKEDPAEIAEVLDSRRSDLRSLALFGKEPLARPEQYRNPFV